MRSTPEDAGNRTFGMILHDHRSSREAEASTAEGPGDDRDSLDLALRNLGRDILDEPVPPALLSLLDALPAVRRA